MFVLAKRHAAWVRRLASDWENGEVYKQELASRESIVCALCRANMRMRAQARVLLDMLELRTTRDLAAKLVAEPQFTIYEAATRTVFRTPALHRANYIGSEFREGAPRGAIVDGVRNEDLQALSFPDASLDVVLTSDVLEHVADLDRARDEIVRVLKPGGWHVFTIPTDVALPRTIERARIVDGVVVHERPALYHGDSIRGEGILAFRDFGADACERMSHPDAGCRAVACAMPEGRVATVYVMQKRR